MTRIYLHGLGQTPGSWEKTLEYSGGDEDCVCPDLTKTERGERVTYSSLYARFSDACGGYEGSVALCGLSLGAVLAIAFGVTIPGLPFSGTMLMAILFAFLSLLVILGLAYKLDYSLSTNTIILIGVIYSMFMSSLMSIVITFASDKIQSITFWTMGSLQNSSYKNAVILLAAFLLCGGVLFLHARELNAFAVGEDNARHIGVDVRRTKLTVLIMVSILIGVCVSVGGTISFVGLVTPHMVRMIVGPNHRRLLPASAFGGAVFLLLADLAARILLNPRELPIGVVTSLVGAVVFVFIFYQTRKE